MRNSAFFGNVQQLEIPTADRSIKVPVFYYDGAAMTAVFPARYSALQRLLKDPELVPARLAPGVGAVSITAFEYRDTDIGPYNELAIAVPLNEPAKLNLPGRALLGALRRNRFHAWVQHLPVTTEIARAGGVEFYNYPKFLAFIEFDDAAGRRTCRLNERDAHILTFEVKKIPTPNSAVCRFFSHLWMDERPQGAEFKINAIELGMSARPGLASVTLGQRHPIARELDGLLLSRRAIHLQYMPRIEGILYGPDHPTLPVLHRILKATPGMRTTPEPRRNAWQS